MTSEALFMLAMPALVAAFIIWMIAAGYTTTDAIPPGAEPNLYPERLDRFGRVVVGIASASLYILVAVTIDPWAAAMLFAFLLAFGAVGALIRTCGQEAFGRRAGHSPNGDTRALPAAVPFAARLRRNFRDFYVRIVLLFLAH